MVLPNDVDLLNPARELEKWTHKLKNPVPNDLFFTEVKCQSCFNIQSQTAVMCGKCQSCFNIQSQTAVMCGKFQTVLCQPTGGRPSLTGGCSCDRNCHDVCTLPNRVPCTQRWLCKTLRVML